MRYFEDFDVTPLHNVMENQPTNVICSGVTYSFDYDGIHRTVYCLRVGSTLISGIEKESNSYKNFTINKILNMKTSRHFLTHNPKMENKNFTVGNLTIEEQLVIANMREPNTWEIKDGKLVRSEEQIYISISAASEIFIKRENKDALVFSTFKRYNKSDFEERIKKYLDE